MSSIIDLLKAYNELTDKIEALVGSRPTVNEIEDFPFKIYSFIIHSIRDRDKDVAAGGTQLLNRMLLGCQELWITINKKPDDLYTLHDPESIDKKYLDSLRKLVAFGDEYPEVVAKATEEELRRIIARATLFWMNRFIYGGLVTAVRLITGNRFKLRNWFDFRFIIGETNITEDLADEDPWVLGETIDTFFSADDGIAGQDNFGNALGPFLFASPTHYPTSNMVGALIVVDDISHPAYNGIYQVASVDIPLQRFWLTTPFPVGIQTALTFSILFEYNEYLSEIRLVDDYYGYNGVVDAANPTRFTSVWGEFDDDSIGKYVRIGKSASGNNGYYLISNVIDSFTVEFNNANFTVSETGLRWYWGATSVNRELLEELLEIQRANSERINIVYVDFMDLFQTKGDFGLWEEYGAGTFTTKSIDDGYLTLSTASALHGLIPGAQVVDDWKNYEWKSKISLITTTTTFRLQFLINGRVDFYGDYFYLDVTYFGVGLGIARLGRHYNNADTILSTYNFVSLALDTYFTYTVRVNDRNTSAGQLHTDWNMENVGVGDWTVGNAATLTKDIVDPYAGVQCLRIAFNAVANPYAHENVTAGGKFYMIKGWARSDGVGIPRINNTAGVALWIGTISTNWVYFETIADPGGNHFQLMNQIAGAGYVEFDNVEVEDPSDIDIKILVDNSIIISHVETSPLREGNIGFQTLNGVEIKVAETEMWQYPLTIDRVGPNP